MELFLHREGVDAWNRSAKFMHGLEQAIDAPMHALIFSADPVGDCDDMSASVRFFRSGGGSPDHLAVGSPFPSRLWMDPVRQAGAGRVLVVKPPPRWPSTFRLEHALEVPESICASLDVRRYPGGSLSVCGMRGDLVVLVDRHFVNRCFTGWAGCPFWTGAGARERYERDGSRSRERT